ncbi:hypothetical protein [Burkholderia sp. L27(2015)]|uniref:hypothetical protein n=1 Tax=Burkholderia sp. L27(2015) TaxID=1641858 RepID=UPI00131D5AAC|nr:hypothetical protein [Burkholderia sp. L27(2015)]
MSTIRTSPGRTSGFAQNLTPGLAPSLASDLISTRTYDAAADTAAATADSTHEAITPANAAVRRDALLAKMAADRARLRLNLAREDSRYAGNSPGTWARLQNAVNPGAMPSSEVEYESSATSPRQFISDHALSVSAAVLGLLVLGPRNAVFAVLRNLGPLLLARGVRMLLDQHDRSIADTGESAERKLNPRSSMRLGAAGSPHAVSEVSGGVPDEAHGRRRADTARFAAATDSKRNPH